MAAAPGHKVGCNLSALSYALGPADRGMNYIRKFACACACCWAVGCGPGEPAPMDTPVPAQSVLVPPAHAALDSTALERPAVPAVTPGIARVQEPADAGPGALVRVREFHPNGGLFTERSERLGEQGASTRVGPMKIWFENGQLRCEGAYDDEGKLGGHWRYFDERGVLLREGDFASGLREGDWVEYHANGRKRYEGLLHRGQNEGPWKYWHENGQLMAEGSYLNNAREGAWRFFDEEGAPDARFTGFYEKNQRVR